MLNTTLDVVVEAAGGRHEAGVDGLQGGHTTNLMFTLLEAGDRWAPGQRVTTSRLFIIQDRSNRRKVRDWNLSSVDPLNNGNGRGRESLSLAWAIDPEASYFLSLGSGRHQLHMYRKIPLGMLGLNKSS